SLENEKGKNPTLSSVSMRFLGTLVKRSLKYNKNYADESPVENEDEMSKVQKGDDLRVSEEEGMKTKLKGKAVVPLARSLLVASDIPLRILSPRPDQMATINLSSIIGTDPNQFDPASYVEEDFYVMDAFGVSRLIPPTNIIRRREVWNLDGTTSWLILFVIVLCILLVESNARFVIWSNGSLQLLIENEAFGICEQNAQDIESYLFLRHEKGLSISGKNLKKDDGYAFFRIFKFHFDWFYRFNA
ncbi:protein LEO1, partial [Sesamum angolense]